MNLKLELPFNHSVIGYMHNGRSIFAAIERDHRLHPFATYRLEPFTNVGPRVATTNSWACNYGNYFELKTEALIDMARRAVPALR